MKYSFKLIFIYLIALALFSQCKDSVSDSGIESTQGSIVSEVGSTSTDKDSLDQTASFNLEWEKIKQADAYRILISTTEDFSENVVDTEIQSNTYKATDLSFSTTYYWKVQGLNSKEDPSNKQNAGWTDIKSFTTGSPDDIQSLMAKSAGALTLPYPSDGADKTATNLTFKWEEIPGADKYVYQLTDNRNFTSTIHKTTVSGTSYTPDMLVPRKKYYWRVRAAGENSEWSDAWSFTTGAGGDSDGGSSPSAVTLASPSDEADKTATNLTFKWEEIPGADKYVYQLTDNRNFTSTIHKTIVSGTSYTPDMLVPRKKYYWRVRAAGENSEWSDAWSFTTGAGGDSDGGSSPSAVTLASPSDGADEVSTNLTFKWKEVFGYRQYKFQLSDERSFNSVLEEEIVTETSYKSDELNLQNEYFWRVKVAGGEWSEVRSFTTASSITEPSPDTPPPSSPPPPVNSNEFVRVQKGNFVLNGEVFRFAGTNAYYLPNYEKINSGVVDRAFDLFETSGVRVVRMWAFYDGYDCGYSQHDASENVIQTAPGEYSESALRDLDRVIAKGKEKGIRFIMPFVNYWDELGGICQYNTWAGASNPSQNMEFFMNNEKTQKWFKDYISMLLNRVNTVTGIKYKNEPAILGWQIINEGRNSGQNPTVLRGWYRKIAQYIKSIDSNHLLSTGEEGFDDSTPSEYSAGQYSNTYTLRAKEGTSYVLNTAIPEIDFGSAHWYPAEYGFGHTMSNDLLTAQKAWISDHQKIAQSYGKPFYIGEFGIAGWGDDRVSTMYDALFKYAKSVKLDGTLLWQLTADGTKCYEFGGNICYPDGRNDTSLYNSFKSFIQAMDASKSN